LRELGGVPGQELVIEELGDGFPVAEEYTTIDISGYDMDTLKGCTLLGHMMTLTLKKMYNIQ